MGRDKVSERLRNVNDIHPGATTKRAVLPVRPASPPNRPTGAIEENGCRITIGRGVVGRAFMPMIRKFRAVDNGDFANTLRAISDTP